MNISSNPFKMILLLVYLAMPFTVSADAASDNVAAIAADPANAAAITAAAVTAAVAANPDQGEAIAAAIVSAAISAYPDQAVAITTAVITANPGLAAAITAAAIAAAPTQASAIGAAAIAAAPSQASAIVGAFQAALGADTPTQNVSELTTNNFSLEVSVVANAIDQCGGNAACIRSVLEQVVAQSSNPATAAAVIKEAERQASQN
jgi:hypothetical protein